MVLGLWNGMSRRWTRFTPRLLVLDGPISKLNSLSLGPVCSPGLRFPPGEHRRPTASVGRAGQETLSGAGVWGRQVSNCPGYCRAEMEGSGHPTLGELGALWAAAGVSLPPGPLCRAGVSGLCPCAVPGANNTWEEAAVPSPLQERCSAHSHLPQLPAPARCAHRHVPGAAATSYPCSVPAAALPAPPHRIPTSSHPSSALPVSFLQGGANTSIISASGPSGISSVTFTYFRSQMWTFALDWGKKFSLEQGCWLQTGFYPFLTDCLSPHL